MRKKIFVFLILVFAISLSACSNGEKKSIKSANEISMEELHIYSSAEIFDSIQYIYLAEAYNDGLFIYGSMSEDPYTTCLYYCDTNSGTMDKLDYVTNDTTPIIGMDVNTNGELWLVKYINRA